MPSALAHALLACLLRPPPLPNWPSSKFSTKSMLIIRIVVSDLETMTSDDDLELRIPRLRERH
jgi:hypothetical protein